MGTSISSTGGTSALSSAPPAAPASDSGVVSVAGGEPEGAGSVEAATAPTGRGMEVSVAAEAPEGSALVASAVLSTEARGRRMDLRDGRQKFFF